MWCDPILEQYTSMLTPILERYTSMLTPIPVFVQNLAFISLSGFSGTIVSNFVSFVCPASRQAVWF